MNAVSLIGRLTKDVELKKAGEKVYTKVTLAVDRAYTTKEGEPTADFIPLTIFGKSAENCSKYLVKGSLVGVTGRIQTGSYEKDGQKVYTTDILVDRVEFLDKKEKGTAAAAPKEDDGIPAGFSQLTDEDIPF